MYSDLDQIIDYFAEREALFSRISSCLSAQDDLLALWYEKSESYRIFNLIVSDIVYHEIEAKVEPRRSMIGLTGRMLCSSVFAREYLDHYASTSVALTVIYPGTIAPHDLTFTWTPVSGAGVGPVGIDFHFEKVPIFRAIMDVALEEVEPPAYLDRKDEISRAFCYAWTSLYGLIAGFPRRALKSAGSVLRIKEQSPSLVTGALRRAERSAGLSESADEKIFAGIDRTLAFDAVRALLNACIRVNSSLEEMGIFCIDPELPAQTLKLIDLVYLASNLRILLEANCY